MKKFLILAILALTACLLFSTATMAAWPPEGRATRQSLGNPRLYGVPWDQPLSSYSGHPQYTYGFGSEQFTSLSAWDYFYLNAQVYTFDSGISGLVTYLNWVIFGNESSIRNAAILRR